MTREGTMIDIAQGCAGLGCDCQGSQTIRHQRSDPDHFGFSRDDNQQELPTYLEEASSAGSRCLDQKESVSLVRMATETWSQDPSRSETGYLRRDGRAVSVGSA